MLTSVYKTGHPPVQLEAEAGGWPVSLLGRKAFFLEALDVLEVVVGTNLQLDTSSFVTDDDPLRMEL